MRFRGLLFHIGNAIFHFPGESHRLRCVRWEIVGEGGKPAQPRNLPKTASQRPTLALFGRPWRSDFAGVPPKARISMFRGSHITRVDEKGRLKLPADFKRQIDEEYGGQFYITSQDGETAEIYPMREWEKYEQEAGGCSQLERGKAKAAAVAELFRSAGGNGCAGRVLLPQTLREKANLIAEVVVYGQRDGT